MLQAILGAGAGLIKAKAEKDQENKDRYLAAQTALYNPWTGMTPQIPQHAPGGIARAVEGGIEGYSMGAGNALGDKYGELLDAKIAGARAAVPGMPQADASANQAMNVSAGNYWNNMQAPQLAYGQKKSPTLMG